MTISPNATERASSGGCARPGSCPPTRPRSSDWRRWRASSRTPTPAAAASLREGLPETVTLQRLRVDQQLWCTLSSTNPIESMIAICRATSRNVKRWQNGDMCLRWTAAGILEAEAQFRKIIGYKHLAALALAVERDVTEGRAATSRSTTPPTNEQNTTEALATLAPIT